VQGSSTFNSVPLDTQEIRIISTSQRSTFPRVHCRDQRLCSKGKPCSHSVTATQTEPLKLGHSPFTQSLKKLKRNQPRRGAALLRGGAVSQPLEIAATRPALGVAYPRNLFDRQQQQSCDRRFESLVVDVSGAVGECTVSYSPLYSSLPPGNTRAWFQIFDDHGQNLNLRIPRTPVVWSVRIF